MLLTMMILLAISSTIIELMFAAKITWWRTNAYRFKWFNLIISLVLSWILGFAFGAAGLVVMGAAMISTALSVPGYAFLHWNYDSEQAKKYNGNTLSHVRKKWSQAFKDLAKMIYAVIRVLTFPIWSVRWIIQKVNSYKS
jgi:hypothetical protein